MYGLKPALFKLKPVPFNLKPALFKLTRHLAVADCCHGFWAEAFF